MYLFLLEKSFVVSFPLVWIMVMFESIISSFDGILAVPINLKIEKEKKNSPESSQTFT